MRDKTRHHHIAQDALSGRLKTDNTPPHILAAEFTHHLMPWARQAVCYGRERRQQFKSLKHGAHLG